MAVEFNPVPLSSIKHQDSEIFGESFIPFPVGAYTIIAGAGGTGKTALAIQMVLRHLVEFESHKAILVLSEDDTGEIKSRVDNIGCGLLGINGDELDEIREDSMLFFTLDNMVNMIFADTKQGNASINTDAVDGFINMVNNENARIVVLDPLKRFHNLNENSNSHMDVLMRDVFSRIAKECNIALIVLHHTSKGEFASSRGASTITDTSRLSYIVKKKYIKVNGELIVDEKFSHSIKLDVIKDNKGLWNKINNKPNIIDIFRKD